MGAMKYPDVKAVEPPRLYAEIARPLGEALPLYRSEPAGRAL
jgi:hypothetical protein